MLKFNFANCFAFFSELFLFVDILFNNSLKLTYYISKNKYLIYGIRTSIFSPEENFTF
jgi:hypothetical protein